MNLKPSGMISKRTALRRTTCEQRLERTRRAVAARACRDHVAKKQRLAQSFVVEASSTSSRSSSTRAYRSCAKRGRVNVRGGRARRASLADGRGSRTRCERSDACAQRENLRAAQKASPTGLRPQDST